jgi:hypothetical protein
MLTINVLFRNTSNLLKPITYIMFVLQSYSHTLLKFTESSLTYILNYSEYCLFHNIVMIPFSNYYIVFLTSVNPIYLII